MTPNTKPTLVDELRALAVPPSDPTARRLIDRAASLLTSQAAAIREKDEALAAIADMRFNATTNHAELLALILAIAKTATARGAP